MAFVLADRCQETTVTTGTGTVTLAGAVAQFQSFAAGIGTGNSTYYCLLGGNGTDWETGSGTVGGSGPYTLSRDTVLASSNSGAKISLSGTSSIFCDLPASALPQVVGPNVVQTAVATSASTIPSFTLGATPTSGNTLIALFAHFTAVPTLAAGWMQLTVNASGISNDVPTVYYHVCTTGESTTQTPLSTATSGGGALFEIGSLLMPGAQMYWPTVLGDKGNGYVASLGAATRSNVLALACLDINASTAGAGFGAGTSWTGTVATTGNSRSVIAGSALLTSKGTAASFTATGTGTTTMACMGLLLAPAA